MLPVLHYRQLLFYNRTPRLYFLFFIFLFPTCTPEEKFASYSHRVQVEISYQASFVMLEIRSVLVLPPGGSVVLKILASMSNATRVRVFYFKYLIQQSVVSV